MGAIRLAAYVGMPWRDRNSEKQRVLKVLALYAVAKIFLLRKARSSI